jgi:hypothetical protein
MIHDQRAPLEVACTHHPCGASANDRGIEFHARQVPDRAGAVKSA